jgi:hypothetical protein
MSLLSTRSKINLGLTAQVHSDGLKLLSSRLEMNLAMSQKIDFLVMLQVFRRFVSQPGCLQFVTMLKHLEVLTVTYSQRS